MSGDVTVRPGTPEDLLAVMRVLDGAMLDVDAEDVRAALRSEREAVLVAGDDAVAGALVLDGGHVEAVAVRRSARGRGIGSALIEAAAERVDGPLTADFDAPVRAFYESLGFETERREGRLWGVYAGGHSE